MNKTVSNFLLGFLAGAAVGAIAGILFAPEKGSKTRQNLGKKVKDLSDELGLGLGDMLDDLGMDAEPEPAGRKPRASSRKPKATGPKP